MRKHHRGQFGNRVRAASVVVFSVISVGFWPALGNAQDGRFRLVGQAPTRASATDSSEAVLDELPSPDQKSAEKVEPDVYSVDSILDGDAPPDVPDRPVAASRFFSPQYFQNVESPSPDLLDQQTDLQAQTPFVQTPWMFERPEWQAGWWGSVDVSVIKPHVDSGLSSGSLFANSFPANPVHLPFAPLHWTAAPTVRFGYRPTIGRGGFAVSYRGLTSDGTATIPAFDAAGAGQVYSRVNLQTLDVDAVFVDTVERLPAWLPSLLECNVGVRTVGSQFVSSANGQQILSARESNQFVGAGPHFSFKLEWPIRNSPWSVYAFGDFAGLIGQNRQDFSQTMVGVPRVSDTGSVFNTAAVEAINVQAGVSYMPVYFQRRMRLTGGYQFENWWNIGTASSNSEFQFHGFVVRGYWQF